MCQKIEEIKGFLKKSGLKQERIKFIGKTVSVCTGWHNSSGKRKRADFLDMSRLANPVACAPGFCLRRLFAQKGQI
jgi:hypothetical protein